MNSEKPKLSRLIFLMTNQKQELLCLIYVSFFGYLICTNLATIQMLCLIFKLKKWSKLFQVERKLPYSHCKIWQLYYVTLFLPKSFSHVFFLAHYTNMSKQIVRVLQSKIIVRITTVHLISFFVGLCQGHYCLVIKNVWTFSFLIQLMLFD